LDPVLYQNHTSCRSLVLIILIAITNKSSRNQKITALKKILSSRAIFYSQETRRKNKNMKTIAPLSTCNSDYYSNTNIAVSLDDKYIGVVNGETNDKIVVISEERKDHNRFEIPKCKIMMISSSPSINKRMILDLEYSEILKYKID
jgi:hypothetical protein